MEEGKSVGRRNDGGRSTMRASGSDSQRRYVGNNGQGRKWIAGCVDGGGRGGGCENHPQKIRIDVMGVGREDEAFDGAWVGRRAFHGG